ncbi:MAG: GerMN domain-containing protein [Lachnospiraceae bacterium]|nr:GerMN domain-containing protein [Lachnospiraceae bacterium]
MKRIILLLVSLLMVLAGCGTNGGAKHPEGTTEYKIFHPDRDLNKMVDVVWYSAEKDTDQLIEDMIEELKKAPEDVKLRETILGFDVVDYSMEGNALTLTLSEEYLKLDMYAEILTRAALVRTLCQIEDVQLVAIKVGDMELTDSTGMPIGFMSAEEFLDNKGKEINSMEMVQLALYFPIADGTGISRVTRKVVYNSNISTEKLVVEQLIKGPLNDKMLPALNPETKIINVTTKDGVCYVSLSAEFLTFPENVSMECSIYSVVDSLTNLRGVNKVQINIDNDQNILVDEKFNFDDPFERNLEIIQ